MTSLSPFRVCVLKEVDIYPMGTCYFLNLLLCSRRALCSDPLITSVEQLPSADGQVLGWQQLQDQCLWIGVAGDTKTELGREYPRLHSPLAQEIYNRCPVLPTHCPPGAWGVAF